MIRVFHVITGLGVGGAERTLERLLAGTDRHRFRGSVVSLLPRGPHAEAIERDGWPVRFLNLAGKFQAASAVGILRHWLRRDRPDIVQTWMYHADLLGGLAARSAGCRPVVWNVRSSLFPAGARECKWTTRWVGRACATLSRTVPASIVCGSHAALASHAAAGYPKERLRVIPNGVEIPALAGGTRASVRRELGLAEDTILIGRIGRYDPMKDYATFLQAAALLVQRGYDAHFLLCGDQVSEGNGELLAQSQALGLAARCHLLGPRSDVPRLHASLDVACSSSYREGFPNVVAEAMAAGVPCVVTDAGDSAVLVGDTGHVVPTRSPSELADALATVVAAGPDRRRKMGEAARRRVAACFSVEAMVDAYQALYEELLDCVRH